MRAAKAMMFFTKGYQETVQQVVKVIIVYLYSQDLGGEGGGDFS